MQSKWILIFHVLMKGMDEDWVWKNGRTKMGMG